MALPNGKLEGSGAYETSRFASTHWSVVRSAGENSSTEALERICRSYWKPIFNFVRRQGYRTEEAQDLTQSFFSKLLEKNFWARANPEKGRFRSFLLTALRQFLADQRDHAHAAKRGGGVPLISIDESWDEPSDGKLSVEQQFDRNWALQVLEAARASLRQECLATGKGRLYECVNLLADEERSRGYAEIASELGMSVGGVKSAVSRLRERYGELVRDEVARTVRSAADVDAEIGYLLAVLGR